MKSTLSLENAFDMERLQERGSFSVSMNQETLSRERSPVDKWKKVKIAPAMPACPGTEITQKPRLYIMKVNKMGREAYLAIVNLVMLVGAMHT